MKISETVTWAIQGGPALAAQASSLVQGRFVGLDSSGNVKLADFLASAGPVVARGVLREDIQRKDPKGNVVNTDTRASYQYQGVVHDILDSNGATLEPGATYYLSSGGMITKTPPATTTDDLDQKVGWAKSATELVIDIGTEVIHA